MSIHKSYAVFGLGKYGTSVAKELASCGVEVLAVDRNEALVNALAADVPVCRTADVTDPEVIKQLGIKNFDVVIIAMAQNLEASVLATTLCKEVGVETVIAKCANEIHQKILRRVGADQVIFPEKESGVRLAKNLLSSGFVDIIDFSENVSLFETRVRSEWVGKTLLELDLRKKYSMNVVALKQGDDVQVGVDPKKALTADMTLIVIADIAKLGKLK